MEAAPSHLSLLPSVTPELPDDPLPLEERSAYQRQLLEDFLVSRRSIVSRSSVLNAVSALRANFFPWLEAAGLYTWEVTPGDLDRWALTLKHSVKTRTHQQYFIHLEQFYDWIVSRREAEIRRLLGVEVRNPVDRFNRARRMPEGERLVPVPREEVIQFFLAVSRTAISMATSDVKWLQACRNYVLWMVLN